MSDLFGIHDDLAARRATEPPRPLRGVPTPTWTAGELAHQLRFVDPDTEVFIVGAGQLERVSGFGAFLRRRAKPFLRRRVFGIRVRRTENGSVVYIEGKQ